MKTELSKSKNKDLITKLRNGKKKQNQKAEEELGLALALTLIEPEGGLATVF